VCRPCNYLVIRFISNASYVLPVQPADPHTLYLTQSTANAPLHCRTHPVSVCTQNQPVHTALFHCSTTCRYVASDHLLAAISLQLVFEYATQRCTPAAAAAATAARLKATAAPAWRLRPPNSPPGMLGGALSRTDWDANQQRPSTSPASSRVFLPHGKNCMPVFSSHIMQSTILLCSSSTSRSARFKVNVPCSYLRWSSCGSWK